MDTKAPNDEDTFLAQWLEGKISDDDLKAQVGLIDFNAYVKLKETLNLYEVAQPDTDKHFAAVKTKLAKSHEEKPLKKIRPYVYMAVAASLLLLFGLFGLFAFSNHAQSGFGQSKTLDLADGSRVKINAKSTLDYPALFKYNRELRLYGEAFFEVRKGSKFTVQTALGEVEVLGTKFNVVSQGNFFEVVCFDGRVKVCHASQTVILTQGNAVRFFNGSQENWKENPGVEPGWIGGESSFRNTPLEQVIHQFENQYDLKIVYPKILARVRFTGSFTHNNQQKALQSICLPLQLKPQETGSKKITIVQ